MAIPAASATSAMSTSCWRRIWGSSVTVRPVRRALDVSVQSQILNLLRKLRDEMGLTMIFISHDLTSVEQLCDTAVLLDRGSVVDLLMVVDAQAVEKSEDILAGVPTVVYGYFAALTVAPIIRDFGIAIGVSSAS